MPDKHQFTLKWLLVEVALISVCLGAIRFAYLFPQPGARFLVAGTPFPTFSLTLMVAGGFLGAAIGNIIGRLRDGAIGGVVFFLAIFVCLFLRSI